jgi:uncharacterized protein with HEPN domain
LLRERLYVLDIAKACRKVIEFSKGYSLDTFATSGRSMQLFETCRSLVRRSRSCLTGVRDIRPEQEWAKIAGLRNLLVHHYFGLDEQVLWDAVQNDVPPLLVAVEAILDDPRLA